MGITKVEKGSQEYPVISCILPTYNRADVLPRAISSVLGQTFKNFELIVCDDASKDGTETVVRSYRDERIVYQRNEKNLGPAGNRNAGIRRARGRFIVTLDDDNEFMPTYFQESVDLLDGSLPIVGGVRVGRVIFQEGGFKDYASPVTHTGFDAIDWGFLMKREVFDDCWYDERCYGDEDADFGIQFAKRWKSLPIDKPLQVSYCKDEGSVCQPTERRIAGLEYFIAKNLAHYRTDANELRYLYRLAGRNFYRAGHKLKGLKYFWLSFWAKKNLRTLLHFFFILFGWRVYDWYMDRQERSAAKERIKYHGL